MTAKQSQYFIRCISAEADLITADIFWLTASMFSSRKRCEAVSQLLMVLLSHLLMVLLSFTTRVRQNGKNRPTTPWEYLNAWITNSLLMQWSVPCRSHTKIPPSLECCIDYTLATRESIDHMNVLLNWMSYRPGNNTLFDSVQSLVLYSKHRRITNLDSNLPVLFSSHWSYIVNYIIQK